MKRVKLFMLSLALLLSFGIATVSLGPTLVSADAAGTACASIGSDASCSSAPGSVSINTIIKVIINILSLVIGVTAVVMIIIGGFRYITSGGDSNRISSAKNTIIYAIIGLVIVALAQFIVQFVLNKTTTQPAKKTTSSINSRVA